MSGQKQPECEQSETEAYAVDHRVAPPLNYRPANYYRVGHFCRCSQKPASRTLQHRVNVAPIITMALMIASARNIGPRACCHTSAAAV
jgi:hypothetical protein